MRVAMVSEHASPLATLGGVDAGGQNVYVAALSQALAARGHEIEVYTRRDDPRLPERVALGPNVDVVHVPAGPPRPLIKDDLAQWMPAFGDWLAEAWSARAGRGARPDLVHAHFWMSGVAASRALSQVQAPVPLVQTFHALGSVKRRFQGRDDSSPANRVEIERILARTATAVIATCSDEVEELARMDATPHEVRIVPCGVDLDRFSPIGASSSSVALPAGTASATRLVCVGRLVPRKGIETVVQALTELPDHVLAVVGGPDAAELDADGEATRLRALADRLQVGDRVHLIGRVEHDELPALLRWADVVVGAPWYEPFGIVPLEAMACGRPFVGTAVGGLLDTVLPGVNGLLVPPQDPSALARALNLLREFPGTRQAMGQAARQSAMVRYGWGTVAETVESIYTALIETSSTTEHLLTAEAM
jgi:D-inositol-3-phosphate glycosyltransferase